ncbi:MAG: hypothetical protein J6X55_11730 [Victivallales bacterium]|nr:hypothetical protein [Victivallales bacterium]
MRDIFSRFLLLLMLASVACGAITLQNPHARWMFDEHGLAEVNGMTVRSGWELILQSPEGTMLKVESGKSSPTITDNGSSVTLAWTAFSGNGIQSDLKVKQIVMLQPDGSSEWNTIIENSSQNTIHFVESPILTGIPATMMALPDGGGRLVTDNGKKFAARLNYPENASMQFLAAWNSEGGISLATHDPRYMLKCFRAACSNGLCTLSTTALPAITADAKVANFRQEYPIIIRQFKGDWKDAVANYASWAKGQVKPLEPSSALPADAYWLQSKFEPSNAIKEWAAASQHIKKPIIAPYHSYSVAWHHYFSPDILPLDPYLRSALRSAPRYGVTPVPMISARVWDLRSDSYASRKVKTCVEQDENGLPVILDEAYRNSAAVLCSTTAEWRHQLADAINILIEHGAEAVCIEDLLTPPLSCFNSSHGHLIHGGDYAITALRAALDSLRMEARKANPRFAIVLDTASEALIGHADAFIVPACDNAIPLFATVYGETCKLGSPTSLPKDKSEVENTGDIRLLYGQEDLFFPFVTSETDDELWGCDDAIVIRNPKKMHGMLKPSYRHNNLAIRKSSLYIVSSPSDQIDGSSLPSEWETQNFACLYKLPYTMRSKHLVSTVSGGENYLALNCHTNDKSALFSTERRGVFAARLIADRKANPEGTFMLFKTPDELNAAFQAQEITAISSIGYAAFDDATLKAAVHLSQQYGLKTDNLAAAWKQMAIAPSLENLSTLNHEVHNWFLNANHCQQIFAPNAAGEQLLKQAQALVIAAALTPIYMNQPMLAFEAESIMPGVPQPVATAFMHKTPEALLEKTTLTALGIKAPAVFSAIPIKNKEDEHHPGFMVTLSNPPEDLQVFTLAAWMPFTVQGVELLSMDIGWLTVSQPIKLFASRSAAYISPGCTSTFVLTIQNTSTSGKHEYETSVEAPEGWEVLIEPKISKPELLSTCQASIVAKVPATLPSGHATLPVTVKGVGLKEVRQDTFIDLDCVHAPVAVQSSALPSETEQELHIPGVSMLAFYPKKDERYAIRITNSSDKQTGWALRNPNFEVARNSSLPPNDSMKINGTAVRDAAYYLSISSTGNTPVTITSTSHALSRRASDATPAVIAEDNSKFYFHVSGDFSMMTRHSPASADISLISPTGRIISCEQNAMTRVKAADDEKGKAWTLSLDNARGIAVSISGNASPWLAQTPETILK